MTDLTPAAAWMDRLSDRIGAFIPGCGRLGPRHPIKVSIVMGALGLASGWLTMVVGAAVCLGLSRPRLEETPVFLVAGVVLALVVVVPWAAWLGTRTRWFVLLVVCCAAVNAALYGLIEIFSQRDALGLVMFGGLTGLQLALAGQLLVQQPRGLWMLLTMIVSAAGLSSFSLIKDHGLLRQLLPDQVFMPLIVGWFFSLLHSPSALCLGVLLWDWTPRANVDPDAQS